MGRSDTNRVAYIDWLRGFAAAGMFEVHCYDAWLGGTARQSSFFHWTQTSGSVPAPLFIFLSGVSFALITDKMRRKGLTPNRIAARTLRRGAQIFAFGLLFRVQEYYLGQPWAPATDLARVDVLNMIGLAIIGMSIACWLVRNRVRNAFFAASIATAIAMLTPPLWTTWAPRWLPWYLESYVNGVHNLGSPQPWLFALFPWTAFAFAGLAVGLFLFSDWGSEHRLQSISIVSGAGVLGFYLSQLFDRSPIHLYAVYDYWHSSPDFVLARLSIVMAILFGGYAWCRWGLGNVGFSPFRQLGQTSLLVYWLHIEFVYGRFSLFARHAQSVWVATLGLIIIFSSMLLVSMVRTRTKGRSAEILAWIRREPQTAVEGD